MSLYTTPNLDVFLDRVSTDDGMPGRDNRGGTCWSAEIATCCLAAAFCAKCQNWRPPDNAQLDDLIG